MNGTDPLPESQEEPTSDGRLGEWYANVKSLPFRGKSVVIFFNVNTYITILVPGNGTRKMLPEFVERTGRLLQWLDVPQPLIDEEMDAMQEIRLLKTDSRSILGSMNDVAHHLDAYVDYHRLSSAEQMDWDRQERILTEHIFGAINKRRSEGVTYPKHLVKKIFEI
uniref:DUF6933 domain-containing protein n=1 Tax=Rhodohalobacter sp. 8-1 TaxID=3131972 RepID=UPI0030EE5415